jgi:glutamyl-tRNA reductase
VELRSRADEIRRAEVDKARRRLGPLTPEQEKALDAVTSGIVNKLLHSPTVELKRMAGNRHHTEHVGLIRKLFGL